MAIKPQTKNFTGTSLEVLNAIKNGASRNYKNYIPYANDAESVREIGTVIMDHVELKNEFLNTLVNRIGKAIITSKTYENPWAVFKKGTMEMGETIEEIFVELCKVEEFNVEDAENTLQKRNIPDIRTAFHVMNYKKLYPLTIQDNELKRAFLTIEGVNDLISKIIEKVYTSANYDEFLTMQYMLGRSILDGRIKVLPTTTDLKIAMVNVKKASNDMTMLNNSFNLAGVRTSTVKEDQYILIGTRFDAEVDINVLATAFNMDKAEFIGKRILLPDYMLFDTSRCNELFKDDPNYKPFTVAELTLLANVELVNVDRDFFQVYDNDIAMEEGIRNGKGRYTNYFYHTWKTFSISPFAQCFLLGTEGFKTESTSGYVDTTILTQDRNVVKGERFIIQSSKNGSVNGYPQYVYFGKSPKSTITNATVSSGGSVIIPSDAQTGQKLVVSVYYSVRPDGTEKASTELTFTVA